jgi:hypothetical protein
MRVVVGLPAPDVEVQTLADAGSLTGAVDDAIGRYIFGDSGECLARPRPDAQSAD